MNAIPNPLTTCVFLAYVYDRIRVLIHALAWSADEDSSKCFYDYDAEAVLGVTHRSLSGADRTNLLCLQHESPGCLLTGNANSVVPAPSRSAQPTWTILLVVYYYGYRFYSPGLGRWISEDPLLDPGSVPVMIVKRQMLGMLEAYAGICVAVMLDEELPDDARIMALFELINTGKLADSLMRNEPVFWLLLAGNNWLLFCGNDAINLFDLLGLCEEDVSWSSRFVQTIVSQISSSSMATRQNLLYRAFRYGEWSALGEDFREQWDEMNVPLYTETGGIKEEALQQYASQVIVFSLGTSFRGHTDGWGPLNGKPGTPKWLADDAIRYSDNIAGRAQIPTGQNDPRIIKIGKALLNLFGSVFGK